MSAKNIESFLLKISKDLNVDGKKLVEEWEEYSSSSNEKVKKVYNKCIYEFVRAPHTGKKCGASIRKNDSVYCSKHIFSSKKNDEKVIEKDPDTEKVIEKDREPPIPKKIAIRLHQELNKFVHNTSGLVFFSKNEQVVYGKVIDGVIKELNDEDIETCKKYQFKYDKSKFNLNKNE